MKHRTMCIGGATYDLFVRLSANATASYADDKAMNLPLGAKIRVKEVIESCGGGASNTSVGLARLGCIASFCGIIADDQWGQALLRNLEKEGVDTQCTTIVEGETSSFSLILTAGSGERVILYDPGTNDHLHDATFPREKAANVDWVYLNHIQESSCVIEDDIVEIISGERSPRFTWNPGGCQIDLGVEARNNKKLLAHTNLLLLNKEEALRFTKADDMKRAWRTLLTTGVKHICITDGSKGTMGWDGTSFYRCPVRKDITVVETTGAGDAFGTGATWALLDGKDLPTALCAGTLNAASVVQNVGAQAGLLTHIEMQTALRTVDLDVVKEKL